MKLIFWLIIAFSLLLTIIAVRIALKYYTMYNDLRLDPLEEKYLPVSKVSKSDTISTIWLLGDSRVLQWDTALLAGLKANIVNLGLDGQTTAQVLYRFRNNLLEGCPKYIILEAGINDLKVIGVNKNRKDKISHNCLTNLISIIEICRKYNIEPIVLDIIHTGDIELSRRLVWNRQVDSALVDVNSKLERYCMENNIRYINTSGLLTEKGIKIKKEFQFGFLHLNSEAYKVLSAYIISKWQ